MTAERFFQICDMFATRLRKALKFIEGYRTYGFLAIACCAAAWAYREGIVDKQYISMVILDVVTLLLIRAGINKKPITNGEETK